MICTFAIVFMIPHSARSAPAQVPGSAKSQPTTYVATPTASPAARAARPEVLDLEPAVAQAELIVAARLVDVTDTKIVHGGRNEQVTQQFRFEPVRILKGIYARDSLLMTGQDLGIYRFAEGSDQLARGQLLLILLGRQGQNYYNCNGAPTLNQSIPRLASKDDSLLSSVDVLIGMTRKADRNARVALLRDGLKTAKGRDAAPLLLALGRRAFPASQAQGIVAAIAPHLVGDFPALREVAAKTLGDVLDASTADQHAMRAEAARAISASLKTSGPEVSARVAAIDALGSSGSAARADEATIAWLKEDRPSPTLAETAARLRALGKIGAEESKAEVARAYEALPLDATVEMHNAAGRSLATIDPQATAKLVPSRLAAKEKAGLAVAPEIAVLGQLPSDLAVPGLLSALARPLDQTERYALAQACVRVADPRLIPALATMLDPRYYQVRMMAMDALVKIDTDESAAVVWPHLDEEADLSRKLRLVAFVGRHGYRDGYAYAIEHLSQATLREEAVDALAALGERKALPELMKIWETSNDLAWNASAIRALARLGQKEIAPKLLEIARAAGDPLASSALIALGDLGTTEALPIVAEALSSRSDVLVIAATRAAAKLAVPADAKDCGVVREKLAMLLSDANASIPVRQSAMEAMIALDDPRLPKALAAVVRDANLEGQTLLIAAETHLAKPRSPRNEAESKQKEEAKVPPEPKDAVPK